MQYTLYNFGFFINLNNHVFFGISVKGPDFCRAQMNFLHIKHLVD